MADLYAPWSLAELVEDLRLGRTTPTEAHARALGRIAETEGTVHAWVEQRFLDAPAEVDGPLSGAPMGVKDIIDLRGFPTRCGSVLRQDSPPPAMDASVVAAWRGAGAVPLGKTVTTEFAFFNPGPTDNPAAIGHTPGGSSSGSAAAVASGQVPLALGSQTAGSVTRPASYCGVASLVMTHGSYPLDGIVGLSDSFDSHGVYAARTRDLAVAWSALNFTEAIVPTAPNRVLIWDAAGSGVLEDDMRAAVERTTETLRARGIAVELFPEADLIAEVTAAHPRVMAYEAARERRAELAKADQLSAPLANLLRTGAAMSDSEYDGAVAVVERGKARMGELLEPGLIVLGPAALGAAPAGLSATGDPVLSRAWQALGLPTVTIPGLRNAQGLPLGIQSVGARESEASMLASAQWVEDALR